MVIAGLVIVVTTVVASLCSVVDIVVFDTVIGSVLKIVVQLIELMLDVVLQGLAIMEIDVMTVGVTLIRSVGVVAEVLIDVVVGVMIAVLALIGLVAMVVSHIFAYLLVMGIEVVAPVITVVAEMFKVVTLEAMAPFGSDALINNFMMNDVFWAKLGVMTVVVLILDNGRDMDNSLMFDSMDGFVTFKRMLSSSKVQGLNGVRVHALIVGGVVDIVMLNTMVSSVLDVMIELVVLVFNIVLESLSVMEINIVAVGISFIRGVRIMFEVLVDMVVSMMIAVLALVGLVTVVITHIFAYFLVMSSSVDERAKDRLSVMPNEAFLTLVSTVILESKLVVMSVTVMLGVSMIIRMLDSESMAVHVLVGSSLFLKLLINGSEIFSIVHVSNRLLLLLFGLSLRLLSLDSRLLLLHLRLLLLGGLGFGGLLVSVGWHVVIGIGVRRLSLLHRVWVMVHTVGLSVQFRCVRGSVSVSLGSIWVVMRLAIAGVRGMVTTIGAVLGCHHVRALHVAVVLLSTDIVVLILGSSLLALGSGVLVSWLSLDGFDLGVLESVNAMDVFGVIRLHLEDELAVLDVGLGCTES